MIVPPTGPTDARIMLVGEAPGEQEVLRKEPFVGASGQELNRMLHEAGITRSECFITNVCRMRPPANDIEFWIPKSKKEAGPDFVPVDGRLVHPAVASGIDHLRKEIALVKPNIIVAFGNTPLWALTGESGIKTWRGSLLEDRFSGTKLVPTYHPAYILRDWTCRAITVQDLRRVASEQHSRTVTPPSYSFLIRPSFTAIQERLNALFAACQEAPTRLAVDIETRAGHIACLGIATSRVEAFCIPLMCVENPEGYWSAEDEAAIVAALRRVLCHPNAQVIGQNFLYDAQYIYRHWGFVPNFCRDTMLGHHVCFAGDIPKGLGFLSSMYCQYHRYWKDEGKTWDRKTGEEQLWAYNCKDAVATFEVDERIQEQVDRLGLREQHDFQQAMFWPVLEAMLRGCRISTTKRSEFAGQLLSELEARERWFEFLLDHPLNPKSSPQMKALFYEDLKQKPIYSRKKASKGALTLDDEALQTIARREPLLRPLIRKISEYRSLGVFLSTFVNARLGADGRLRCSYNIAGTETFRLSSSKDAFDSGTNLQNVPEGGKDGDDPDELELPNVRVLFVPDPGYEFFNADLDRADLQVVVAESDDNILRQMMREGVDIHAENAKVLGCSRPMAKGWVHATNYGCSPRTAAINFGLLVHAAEQMQKRWFAAHPGILAWHKRTEEFLRTHRFVQNRYGFRRYYFDRVEGLLPEALAWIPQSTVGIYINRVWRRLYERQPQIQVLLQVHDSLAGQFPSTRRECCVRAIREEAAQIVVPYEQPLVIPLSVETSRASWGECE